MFLHPNLSNPSFRSFYISEKRRRLLGGTALHPNALVCRRRRSWKKKVAMEHMQARSFLPAAKPSGLRKVGVVLVVVVVVDWGTSLSCLCYGAILRTQNSL